MPTGRRGHARVAVLTVVEAEFDAALDALGATHEVGVTGVFAPVVVDDPKPQVPFVVGRCAHRSNMPAQSSTTRMVEDWRPEILVLVGIAGGIMRASVGGGGVEWEGPAPGDVVLAEYIHYAEFTKNVPSGSKLRYFPIDQPTSSLVQDMETPSGSRARVRVHGTRRCRSSDRVPDPPPSISARSSPWRESPVTR